MNGVCFDTRPSIAVGKCKNTFIYTHRRCKIDFEHCSEATIFGNVKRPWT